MRLQNGKRITISRWDLIIAHPPCTYLSNVAVRPYARLEQENAQLMNRCFVITNGFLCSSCILSDKCHFFEKFVGKEGSNGTFNH